MLPTAVAQKIAKLIPLLSSNQEGEVLAAVRAIGRTLEAEKLDFHSLAAAVEGGERLIRFTFNDVSPAASKTDERPRQEFKWPKRHGLPIWGTSKIEPWHVVAEHCLQINWRIPKAAGGKFLTREERDRLKGFTNWGTARTDEDADWIEGIWNRCYAARDVWRQPKTAAAA